jgi:pimeloyl-ACP methyl ester carboxylesterase
VSWGIIAVWQHPTLIYPFGDDTFNRPGYALVISDGAYLYVSDIPNANETVLFFMGNGGALSYFQPIFATHERAGRRVVAMQYPDGGGVSGPVSEDILKVQALGSYDWMVRQGWTDVIVHGYSMGTSLAQYVASERNIAAIILDAPFMRMCEIMTRKSWLPACYLPGVQKWDSAAYATDINAPVLIQHGAQDRFIPTSDSTRLARLLRAEGNVVTYTLFEDADHNNLPTMSSYGTEISEFLATK